MSFLQFFELPYHFWGYIDGSGIKSFNDKHSFDESGIVNKFKSYFDELSEEDLKLIAEINMMDDVEDGAINWTPKKFHMKHANNVWVISVMTEITNALHTKTGKWPSDVHALLLSFIFGVRIIIIQDDPDEGLSLKFDTTGETCRPDKRFNDQWREKDTCYLRRCDGSIPEGMCHWTKNPIHFEWLMPVVDDPSGLIRKMHTKVAEVHPMRNYIHSE